MRLYLIRHPLPEVAPGICYGRTDLPLAGNPSAVADALTPQLPVGVPLFSSPLTRCRRLAELLHLAPIIDDRLREIDFGDWEMQPWDRLDRAQLDAWAADPIHFAPPNGESVELLLQRAQHFLHELSCDAVVVTHAGIIKVLAGLINAAPLSTWLQYTFQYGSLTVLHWDNR
jgi:alpha-ribazole phosphatase